MPRQNSPAARAVQVRAHEEPAIAGALSWYLGTAPAGTSAAETSSISALHRYFAKT